LTASFAVYTTRSSSPTTAIIRSTFGVECSCCMQQYLTYLSQGTKRAPGHGGSALVSSRFRCRDSRRINPGRHILARDQSLLQTLILPVLILPTLLPTPLLEPRYFLLPYILLRAQVVDVQPYGVFFEGLWYAVINIATTYVFLYKEREGVVRFMW
jgi:hypothetical protein